MADPAEIKPVSIFFGFFCRKVHLPRIYHALFLK